MPQTTAERQRAFKEAMREAGYVRLEAYVTKEQREKFRQLGGDDWLRKQIEKAARKFSANASAQREPGSNSMRKLFRRRSLIQQQIPALLRETQNLPVATPCRFDSGLRHQSDQALAPGSVQNRNWLFPQRFPQNGIRCFRKGIEKAPLPKPGRKATAARRS